MLPQFKLLYHSIVPTLVPNVEIRPDYNLVAMFPQHCTNVGANDEIGQNFNVVTMLESNIGIQPKYNIVECSTGASCVQSYSYMKNWIKHAI